MSGIATATIGAAIVGGYVASQSADKAANAQIKSADAGIAQQQYQFDKIQELLSPYVQAGTGTSQFDGKAYLSMYPDVAADPYFRLHPEEHYEQYGKFENRQKPLISEGGITGSLQAQQDLLGLRGNENQQAAINGIMAGPQYQSMVQSGENAILQNASATGGLRGGNTQAALAQFRPQLLADLIQQRFGNLQQLTNVGQSSAAGVGSAALGTGNQITSLYGQQGAANAGNYLAQGTAYTNIANSIPAALSLYNAQNQSAQNTYTLNPNMSSPF